MTTARIRSVLAATAVGAILAHGLSGHSLPQASHDGMAGATAGICLLLFTVLGYAAVPEPEEHRPTVVADAVPRYLDPPVRPPLDGKARASPTALQRFLN